MEYYLHKPRESRSPVRRHGKSHGSNEVALALLLPYSSYTM